MYNALLPLSRYSHCFGRIIVFVLNPLTTWKYLYWHFYKNCMFLVFESFSNFFPGLLPCRSWWTLWVPTVQRCSTRRWLSAREEAPYWETCCSARTSRTSTHWRKDRWAQWQKYAQCKAHMHTKTSQCAHTLYLFIQMLCGTWMAQNTCIKKAEWYILPSLASISSTYPQ